MYYSKLYGKFLGRLYWVQECIILPDWTKEYRWRIWESVGLKKYRHGIDIEMQPVVWGTNKPLPEGAWGFRPTRDTWQCSAAHFKRNQAGWIHFPQRGEDAMNGLWFPVEIWGGTQKDLERCLHKVWRTKKLPEGACTWLSTIKKKKT